MLVFLPVFFLDGLPGSFFRPLALAYVLAILASLLVALTVTPALSLMLLPRSHAATREAPLVARAQGARIGACCRGLIAAPRRALAIVAGSHSPAALVAFPFLGEEFLPHFKETTS